MYYPESISLISSHPALHNAFEALDRLIAHAYTPDDRGFIEVSDGAAATGLSPADTDALLTMYRSTLQRYTPVLCCGERQDPTNSNCVHGHCSLATAPVDPPDRYRIVAQPQTLPDLDPAAAGLCDIMISYKHGDADRLATDLYYHLVRQGKRVFYDKPGIIGTTDWEAVFLCAASHASLLICLQSTRYFTSSFCKKEIAHAARASRKMLRVPCGGPADCPELPWLGSVQEIRLAAVVTGLTGSVAAEIDSHVASLGLVSAPDHRVDGATYLLEGLSHPDLVALCGRVHFLRNLATNQDRRVLITAIVQEVQANPSHTHQLCSALAP